MPGSLHSKEKDIHGENGCCENTSGSTPPLAGKQPPEFPEVHFSFSLAGALLILIVFYKKCISPLLPPCCRYVPTCSAYAAEAIMTHGAFYGSWLAAKRLLRCHPWGGSGYDPVPPKKAKSSESTQSITEPKGKSGL